MHEALHPRDDVDRLYVSIKEGGRGHAIFQNNFDASIRWLEDNMKSAEKDKSQKTIQRITEPKKKKNLKKMGIKTTVWIFQATSKWNLTQKKLDIAKKVKLYERNWISSDSNTRQLHMDQECLPMARETWVQSQVESYQRLKKWYLMPPCLTLSIIRYGSRVK